MHSKVDPKVISETDPTVLVRSLRKTASQGGYSAREVHLLAKNIQKVDRTFRCASNRSEQISAICGWRWRVEHSYTDYAQIKDDKTPHSHGMCGTPRQDYLHQVFRSRAEMHYREGEYELAANNYQKAQDNLEKKVATIMERRSERLEYYRLRWLNNLQEPLMEWMDIKPLDFSNPNLEWRAGNDGPFGERNWPLTEEMFNGPLQEAVDEFLTYFFCDQLYNACFLNNRNQTQVEPIDYSRLDKFFRKFGGNENEVVAGLKQYFDYQQDLAGLIVQDLPKDQLPQEIKRILFKEILVEFGGYSDLTHTGLHRFTVISFFSRPWIRFIVDTLLKRVCLDRKMRDHPPGRSVPSNHRTKQ